MSQPIPPLRMQPAAGHAPSRRSFLRYTGASAVVGSLWLAGCKKDEPQLTPPTITGLSPASGPPGTTLTLTGTSLGGATAVTLGGVAVQFTVVSATSLTLTVPAGASTGAIVVTTPGGSATSSTPFTVTAPPATAPTLTSFAPASALPEDFVTVTGTNFTGATAVTVNGAAATFTVISATSIRFQVPTAAVAGVATVAVTGPGGTGANSTGLTVLPGTVSVGTGDAGVLNYAYALEQLEAAFYTQLRTGSYYTSLASSSAERQVLDDLYYHEVIHRELFKAALGGNALPSLTPNFSSVDFSSRASVLATARTLEDLGSAAYIGVAYKLQSPGYLFLAAKISSVEARHAALVRDLISENTFVANDIATLTTSSTYNAGGQTFVPAGTSIERPLLPVEVAPLVNAYLAQGSKLDVSGIA